MSWQAHYITLFPEMFPGSLGESLAGRAHQSGIWQCTAHNLRDHGEGKHKNVDDTPAGGGAGMVLRADIAAAAIEQVKAQNPDLPLIMPSPRGEVFTQDMASNLAQGPGAIFFCNRFEGIDERVIEAFDCREVSLGDYILSGGEPAALVMSDAIIRLLPGVVGLAAPDGGNYHVKSALSPLSWLLLGFFSTFCRLHAWPTSRVAFFW